MNKTTVALSTEEYEQIITTMQTGFKGTPEKPGLRPSEASTCLILQANLGLRLGDTLRLTPSSFIKDGSRYRLDIIEEKTEKKRTFTVPTPLFVYIENYCLRNGIGQHDRIFPFGERNVQRALKRTCDYLGIEGVSTHSFRKYYATEIYRNNGHDILLVQKLLQHGSPDTTRRYIGISTEQVENAILNHMKLL